MMYEIAVTNDFFLPQGSNIFYNRGKQFIFNSNFSQKVK